jgi:transglutaminase-like putative cysteine protease
MRYNVNHITRYSYSQAVSSCHNLAYLLPRQTRRQTCLSSGIVIDPIPYSSYERIDYFGNRAYHFSIQNPHYTLTVTANSTLEVNGYTDWPAENQRNTCQQAKNSLLQDLETETSLAREFVLSSPLVPYLENIKDYAAPLFSANKPLLSAVKELTEKIHDEFTYDAVFSDVTTPLSKVFAHKRGVCQDFAHFAIACVRAMGFPARYISGYIETEPPPGQQALVGAAESHAWFAVYSPHEGWFGFDPTNDKVAGNQHIVTAWGRDYSDVPPMKGVIYGGGNQHQLNVSVHVERLGIY